MTWHVFDVLDAAAAEMLRVRYELAVRRYLRLGSEDPLPRNAVFLMDPQTGEVAGAIVGLAEPTV